jgi:Gram-negative porin
MDMFGGLTKTSSRIAIAAALGLTVGGFAFTATPAQAADLGGDCCADLEERVAELEATTVRKGNKKVSVTLSGWVVKSMNYWDDGDIDSFVVGDKDADLASRFAITGSATIAPGWTGGFNVTVVVPGGQELTGEGGTFGITANQEQEIEALGGFVNDTIRTLYSYIYIKSDTWGAINWGYLSPASDNPAVLADISGTVIESNAVWFEGSGFFLRPNKSGAGGFAGLDQQLLWLNFVNCGTGGGVGADCFGAPRAAVRYDSPTWGGFSFKTSYGTVEGLPSVTPESNFWDAAVFYVADWNSIKLSAAYAFTWTESNNFGFDCSFVNSLDGGIKVNDCGEAELHQAGASIMHKPSGLGIYGLWQHEEVSGHEDNLVNPFFIVNPLLFDPVFVRFSVPDSEVWYVKPFWRKAWSPIGATVLYGEYGEYNDQFGQIAGADVSFGLPGCDFGADVTCFVTGSEARRWGLGAVQEIDAAAMHLWIRWQHQELDASFRAFDVVTGENLGRVRQGFDDWDLFQVGGIIFF